ncbi:MAG: cupin domain-containing protein [Alphaproteobacteria bacterium]|jgi:uncharacterized cupin superfamily protein|nr:DUF861 domain-containing protein [Rhodospirillaceae bacterium]MBT6204202.1 DUF861 domain-containing protein [Rhodospirillaceae bacterium]MBT6512543.1 DUF861 domain-containing protein [Rhodospirillaceae bacterium]MDG2480537.1 cupin domain-containing protein [Alphaproteobacteria bacterium]
MSDLRPISYSTQGPAGEGLIEWDKIPAEALTAGDPVQTGHNYFTDDTGALTSGVWTCTPMTTKAGPYEVNEYMLVLEGSVTMIHEDGTENTISAGESFVIPKGTPCVWKQSEDIRKFYVIHTDESGEALDADGLKVRTFGHGVALDPVGEQDESRYIGGTPKQGTKVFFQDATQQMTVGLWETEEMHTKPLPFVRNELMHILEGEVKITDGTGQSTTYGAGDTFMVPKGMIYQWDSVGKVRKIFCIFQPKESTAMAQPQAAE